MLLYLYECYIQGCQIHSLIIRQTEVRNTPKYVIFIPAITGVTRRDIVRNINIRRDFRVEPLLEEIDRMQLKWYGHVLRMTDDKLQKKYIFWQPPVSRPVVRPRKR